MEASGVLGQWRLVERGYSIGAGYTVEPVLEDPPRTITFINEEEFTTTLDGFQHYKFYTLTEVKNVNQFISFFITKPDPLSPPDPNRKEFSIAFEGDKLRLAPSYPSRCIEGCHLGFKRFTISSE
jgi:hypothetical protein